MPEIPEMELYKNHLNRWVRGKKILGVRIYRAKSINRSENEFIPGIQGSELQEIERHGKFLLLKLDKGQKLLTHMMLDGRLYYLPGDLARVKLGHDLIEDPEELKRRVEGLPGKPSVLFAFEDGSLLFFCQLTLGYLHLYGPNELIPFLEELGPDPLDSNFTKEEFRKRLAMGTRRSKIKPWLIQQKNLAGIGNAYSNESLFLARLLPVRALGSLCEEEMTDLYIALIGVLKHSIELGGDMEAPFMPGDELTGGFNPYFQVYERAGQPCNVCGEVIRKEEIGGRNAFYCPNCQH